MATKRVCDRCGAEINPFNSITYAGMRKIKNDINDKDYELCVSCAHKLRKWFTGEGDDNGGIPAADVAPVVRCKDCKYNRGGNKCLNPDSFFAVPADDDFCSYGERKEEQ